MNHRHDFIATDMPGVKVCACGVYGIWSRAIQNYEIYEKESIK